MILIYNTPLQKSGVGAIEIKASCTNFLKGFNSVYQGYIHNN